MANAASSAALVAVQQVVLGHPILLIVGLLFLSLVYNKLRPGLRNIPGPPIASFTKLWRLVDVYKGNSHLTALNIHAKYGPVVRIGPNHVSIADPSLIPVIYTTKETFTKTGFYPIQAAALKKKPEMNIFSTRDLDYHRVEKRKMGAAYSLPNLLQSEAGIDSCISLLMERLDEFALKKEPCDLGAWFHYLAFDVVGEISFAKKLGFLEQGKDVEGVMKDGEFFLAYASIIGQIPEMHRLLIGNPLLMWLAPAMETWNPVLLWTIKAMKERPSIKRNGDILTTDVEGHDMLSRWANIKPSDPLKMNERDMIIHLATNLFAGTDTTATALRAILYYLCRNPACMERLVGEIDNADKQGSISHPITYKQATTALPYLGAVVKEAMRLHPPVGMLLERHVAPEGLILPGGYHLPAGTIVGINAWVTNRSPTIFGPDSKRFNPDRWFAASEPQLREMETTWEFVFGAGSRKCLGRNISWIEIHKVVPELLRRYRVALANPEKEWQVRNYWFAQQKGLICTLSKR